MSQLSTVMEELSRLKTFNSRLEVLEQARPELRDQADQEHDGKVGLSLEGRYASHVWQRFPETASFLGMGMKEDGYCWGS